MSSAGVDSELEIWQAAGYGARVEYSRAVMEELSQAATEGFNRVRRGGVEIGGVLFGVRERDGVKILAHRALRCEYAFGPSFTLSDRDKRLFAALVAAPATDPDIAGMQPVGWYHSHTRSEILLSEKDLELYQQYFPEKWQIALVLRPHQFDPVRAGFFFRERDGSVHAASSRQEFVIRLENGKAAARLPEPKLPAETTPAAANPAILERAAPEVPAAEPLSPEPYIAPGPQPGSNDSRRMWTWILAGLAAVLAGALFWVGTTPDAGDVSLHALDVGGQLRIEWSCIPSVVQQSQAGSLEIEDGPRKVVNALSREQLRAGSITYLRTTGNVLVRLTLRGTDQSTRTQMARFLGSPAASSPVEIGATEQPVPVEPQTIIQAPRPPERETKREPEKEKSAERHLKTERAAAQQPPVTAAPPPRKLVLPAASNPGPPEPLVPTPPAIAANSAPQMTTFVPRLPAPAPASALAPAPAVSKSAAQAPMAGKLIWTGKLGRRDTIQIVANHASKGHVTGSLPGVPVRVHVFPAELTQEGLRIFTADPKAVAAPEAPGAQNGWNRTVYVLNPRQASDVTIVEHPGQQNGWNRLALRAERSDHAIIVLRWERIPNTPPGQAGGAQ